jgi:hypothetical protein
MILPTERLEATVVESTDRLTPVGPGSWPVTHPVRLEKIMPPSTGCQADMSFPGQAADQRVSAVLSEVIRTMPAEGLTLREIRARLSVGHHLQWWEIDPHVLSMEVRRCAFGQEVPIRPAPRGMGEA